MYTFNKFTRLNTERGEVRIFEDCDDLAIGLAEYIAYICEQSAKDRRAFAIALGDGSMEHLGELSKLPFTKTVEWHLWRIFWAEEHAVPTNVFSCYRHSREVFLRKIKARAEHVNSVNSLGTPEEVAESYKFTVRQSVKEKIIRASQVSDNPKFDLIILGLGTDGHFASLFPNHALLDPSNTDWVSYMTDSPEPPAERITFTLPVINAAENVVFVATGEIKADIVHLAIDKVEPESPFAMPARLIKPEQGKLVWFLDRESASKLDCYTPPPPPKPREPPKLDCYTPPPPPKPREPPGGWGSLKGK